jgi:hypothetical protein
MSHSPPPPAGPAGSPGPSDAQLRAAWEARLVARPGHRNDCPTPEALLEALEAGGFEAEAPGAEDSDAASPDTTARIAGSRGTGHPGHEAVLLHLARCATCREEARVVGALLQAAGDAETEEAGPLHRPSRRWWRPPPLAAAASLVLVAGGVGLAWWSGMGGDGPMRGGEGEAAALAPQVTCARPGLAAVQWAPLEEAARYRVELFTALGSVLAEGVVEAGEVEEGGASARGRPTLSLELPFDPGDAGVGAAPLRVLVEAHFPGARVQRSTATPLPDDCYEPAALGG